MISGIVNARLKVLFSLLFSLFLALAGCDKHGSAQPLSEFQTTPSTSSSPATFDACGLITKDEIQSIQGSPISDTKSSEKAEGAFRVSQCYYAATESNKSVSLAVTNSGPGKRSPKDFWKETFGRYAGEEKGRDGDKEKKESLREQAQGKEAEREAIPPKKVNGIGEEAYWVGDRVGGALYVLKKNVFIRISVGGPDNEETKMNKSKALAQKAIGRL